MRIGLVQMVYEKAALGTNVALRASIYAEALTRKVDVVALPEMKLSGYICED